MAILQTKTPKVSVVIVNYHTDLLVLNLLSQIGDSGEIEIILVDNSSAPFIESELPKFQSLVYLFQNKNRGFSGANKVGIKQAKGEWVFLLNSDTLTSGEDILKLVKICESEGVSAGAPRLVNEDGTGQQSVGYFDPPHKGAINWLLARPRFVDISAHENTRVDFATGAALLIKKTVFEKVGLLDEKSFFMYFEDIDFCYRLYKDKISILRVPSIKITHFGGKSADQNIQERNTNYTNARNAYIKKHRGSFILFLNNVFKLFV
ncbi:MAG: glycosyltransferase family 2 protein [Microgenomates group bacterium]